MYAQKVAACYDPSQQSSVGVISPNSTLKSWQVCKREFCKSATKSDDNTTHEN